MPDNLTLPNPKLLLRVLMIGGNNLEAMVDRYSFEELVENLNRPDGCKLWAKDENDTEVYICILRPQDIMSFIILDYASYEKTVRNVQLAQARTRGAPSSPIITR